jgi:hypothetical protein
VVLYPLWACSSFPFHSLPRPSSAIYLSVRCSSFVYCHLTTADLHLSQSMQLHRARKGWLYFRFCLRYILYICPIFIISSGTFINRAPNLFLHWAHKCFKSALKLVLPIGVSCILQCLLLVMFSV